MSSVRFFLGAQLLLLRRLINVWQFTGVGFVRLGGPRARRMQPRLKHRAVALLCLLLLGVVAVGRSAAAEPEITLEALNGQPDAGRLAFNRVNNHPSGEYGHDNATLRIRNTGDAPLTVSQLPISSPWRLNPAPALPTTIQPGSVLDVPVRFAAADGDFHQGTLEIVSNDADEGRLPIQLAGFWQSRSEGGMEPGLGHIARVFGITTTLVGPGQRINGQGRVGTVGEEVLSPYWRRADAARPVTVRQLAAFHGCCTPATQAARLQWHVKGSDSRATLFRHAAVDGQSMLPRKADGGGLPLPEPAMAQFNPGASVFGFNVDGEWTDPAKNDQTKDLANGCPGPCGHHVRVWPVRDRSGTLVPHTFLIGGDYNGVNYDYNDNIHLVENVVPEVAPAAPGVPQGLYRLDTGGTRDYLDSNGNWWRSDAGFYAPGTPPAEGITAGQLPADIVNTRDDWLFSSYRGYRGNIPQEQREISYNLPVGASGTYYVRLYFAERYWTAAGKRVQDVLAEGQLLASDFDNFDIFARSGGTNRAYSSSGRAVRVTDGTLNLTFRAVADQPAINGIEVYCATSCPDGQATPTPSAGPSSTPTATSTTQPTATATPSATATPTVTSEPTATPAPTATPTSGPTATPTATASPAPQGELSWTTASPSSPTKRAEAQGAVVGGKLYMFSGYTYYAEGGTRGYNPTRRADVFDPVALRWTRLSDMPKGFTHAGVADDGANVYFAGGYTENATQNGQIFKTAEVWKYDVAANAWSALPPLPLERAAGALALEGRTLHFFGGHERLQTHTCNTGSIPLDKAEHWSLDLDDLQNGWVAKAPLTKPRSHLAAVELDGYIYAIGGQRNCDKTVQTQRDVDRYDPATDSWTTMPPLPAYGGTYGRSHFTSSTFVHDGKIIVIGGEYRYVSPIADVVSFDPQSGQWSALAPLPQPRDSGVAGVIGDAIWYATGGGASGTFTNSLFRGTFTAP